MPMPVNTWRPFDLDGRPYMYFPKVTWTVQVNPAL